MKIMKLSRSNFVGPSVCAGLVGFLLVTALCYPSVGMSAYADQNDGAEETSVQPRAGMNLSLSFDGYTDTQDINLQEQVVAGTPGFQSVKMHVTATGISDTTGYKLFVQPASGSSANLVNQDGTGETVAAIGNPVTGSAMDANTWGYAIDAYNESTDLKTMTYKGISSTTPALEGQSVDADYRLAFGANIGTDKTPGHYKTNVLVSLAAGASEVANLYSVTYNTNNSTAGTTPPTQSAMSDSVTYSFTTPDATQYGLSREGYTFMGWAESSTAIFKDYDANASISLSSADPTKTLYAVWAKPYTLKYSVGEGGGALPENKTFMLGSLPYTYEPDGSYANVFRVGYLATGWNSVTFTAENPNPTTTPTWTASNSSNFNVMQEIGTTGYCNAIGTTGRQLGDLRDGKKYWVAKLSDGNCWMTQNLDYNDPNSDRVTDTSGTNGGPASGKWSTNNATARQYWDPGEKVLDGTTGKLKDAGNADRHLLVGNYYSWLSATNGTNATANKDADDSICPNGWRLPFSGSNNGLSSTAAPKSFGYLIHKQLNVTGLSSDADLLKAPLYFVRGGYVNNGSLSGAGGYGRYWSSTAYNTDQAYALSFNSTYVNPSNNNHRYYGSSVRCVAR